MNKKTNQKVDKELDPKMVFIAIGIVVVILLVVGWKLFLAPPPTPTRTPEDRAKLLGPLMGDEAYTATHTRPPVQPGGTR